MKPPRIPHLRPLRPPNHNHQPPAPRLFNSNTQLLLFQSSRTPLRPQLPYLSQPALRQRTQPLLNHQIARLLSTETKQYFRSLTWNVAKYTTIVFIFGVLGSFAWYGVILEKDERKNPTPGEWRFATRQALRAGREEQDAVKKGRRMVIDWARVGSNLRECVARCEDPTVDGQGIVPVGGEEDEGLLIPGVGRAGFDISSKSYEWRTCYFEAVLGCAVAAEHLDNMVVDTTRGHVFPAEMIVGPSNPDPRPVPAFLSKGVPPREEDCRPAFEAPETYYMRILTGKGFSTAQKLAAVEGYANWLDFKGLSGSAEEMYRWGVDIAKDVMPTPPGIVADTRTDVLTEQASKDATPNLLRATTGLALHHARTGNISAALPIFLSVLRARRNSPVADPFAPSPTPDQDPETKMAKSDIGQAVSWTRSLIRPPTFPPPPATTGDEPLTRSGEKPDCVEAELMLYIGEIVFASNNNSEGVGWTRSAVRIAEENIESLRRRMLASKGHMLEGEEEVERKRCKQCLLTGVGNWEAMLRQLTDSASSSQGAVLPSTPKQREGGRQAGWLEWSGWFGGGHGGVKGAVLDELEGGVREVRAREELLQVEALRERVQKEALQEEREANEMAGGGQRLGGTWIG